jgi:hypothetical protein
LTSSSADLDFDRWCELGLPPALLAACAVCRSGVKRAHLVDCRVDGGLLLELYSRDGVGCMISTDFYEGIRPAGMQDLAAVQELLRPLEERGVLVKRSEEQLLRWEGAAGGSRCWWRGEGGHIPPTTPSLGTGRRQPGPLLCMACKSTHTSLPPPPLCPAQRAAALHGAGAGEQGAWVRGDEAAGAQRRGRAGG